ncbi:MAG: hypothetical protein Q9225_007013 [Loekoesia sp. 1 TL-2023]
MATIPTRLTFLSLPPEIRIKIYRPLLLVDGIINPYPSSFQPLLKVKPDQALPQVSFLRTCRTIHDDASPILYGRNIFRLNLQSSDLTGIEDLIDDENQHPKLKPEMLTKIWKTKKAQLRHIVTGFDMRDVTSKHLVTISDTYAHRFDDANQTFPQSFLDADVFETREIVQRWVWDLKLDLVREFHLTALMVEFDHCYHPNGFPRRHQLRYLLNNVIEAAFRVRYSSSSPGSSEDSSAVPTQITVTGFKNDEERQLCRGQEFWTVLDEQDNVYQQIED